MNNDIELVRRVCQVASVGALVQEPMHFASGVLRDGLLRAGVTLVGSVDPDGLAVKLLDIRWSRGKHQPSRMINPVVRALWQASDRHLGTLVLPHSSRVYREIAGYPVGYSHTDDASGVCQSPASDEELIAYARSQNWVFQRAGGKYGDGVGAVPDGPLPSDAVIDSRTKAVIDDILSIPGCRRRILWGPPGAGKSIAAKQIAIAVGGAWARVGGNVANSQAVWQALEILRPPAIIIDDIDVAAGQEAALMEGIDAAACWARVIVSTANIVPSSSGEQPHALRGAAIRRATDGRFVEYRYLGSEARKAIAPHVPDDLDTSELLARWLSELEVRATYRAVTQDDVAELLGVQALVGDR